MNTEIEQPGAEEAIPKRPTAFGLPQKSGTTDHEKLTAAIAQLETELVAEREDRREKEFIYIAAIAFLASVICFKLLEDTALSIFLFLFELIILTGLARRMGIDWAVRGLGWLAHIISKKFDKDDNDDNDNEKSSK
ncbi:hypothetical protein ACQKKX_11935 [Neorhizobium sp. NPDC001467]|uniref:hypothetical protein n=1 Tax=Neorhizobium sp. NPDC001467 TaxID=3390595 RepID=UPI003D04266C